MIRSRLIIAGLLIVASTAVSAKAQDGLNGLGLAYLYGYNGGLSPYRSFNATPPYFALHPPVYYGQRYKRPYGASPFAAWPQLQAAEGYAPVPASKSSQCCQAAMIINPYAPDAPEAAPAEVHGGVVSRVRTEPLVIENPYYQPQERLAAAK